MTAPILAGAEPFSAEGGPVGALVLHGFTGIPASLRPLAEALADAGLTVELPLLPGHGTAVEDMIETRVAGLGGGGRRRPTASWRRVATRWPWSACRWAAPWPCWLAEHHPEIAGLVVVNPLIEPDRPELAPGARRPAGVRLGHVDAIGSDIAKPGVDELSYPATPLAPLLSLFDGVDEVAAELDRRDRCPVLLLSSRNDHVVPSSSGDFLVKSSGAPASGSGWSAATTWPPSTTTGTRSPRGPWTSSPE